MLPAISFIFVHSGQTSLVGNEQRILELLYTQGPVTVSVDAKTWYNYQGGSKF